MLLVAKEDPLGLGLGEEEEEGKSVVVVVVVGVGFGVEESMYVMGRRKGWLDCRCWYWWCCC